MNCFGAGILEVAKRFSEFYDAGETELCEFESEAKASSENLAGFAHGSGRPFGCLLPGRAASQGDVVKLPV